MIIPINCINVKPCPNEPPAHMLAEKNVKPSITANIFQKPLRLACGTGCSANSESIFFIPIPPFLLQKKLVPEAHIQKKKGFLPFLTRSLFIMKNMVNIYMSPQFIISAVLRSEERRVGKEC